MFDSEFRAFIGEHCGETVLRSLGDGDDLFAKAHMAGDDCSDFLMAFAERYGVDMSGFVWYFHHGEELPVGIYVGRWLFKSPDMRVQRIPITISLLKAAIGAKRWPVDYPPHNLPRRRWDIAIDCVLSPVLTIMVMLGVVGLVTLLGRLVLRG